MTCPYFFVQKGEYALAVADYNDVIRELRGGGGGGGVSAPVITKARAAKSWPNFQMINSVQSATGFTSGGPLAAINLTDKTDFAIGSQCVSARTDGLGGQGWIQLSGLTLDMTGKGVLLWLKVEAQTISDLAYIAVDVGTENAWTRFRGFPMDPNGMLTPNEWVAVQIPWGNFIEGGIQNVPNRANINVIRVSFADKNSRAINLKIGGIATYKEEITYPNGVVSFSFDDSHKSTYDIGFPKLSQYGYKATLYPIVERLSQPGFLSLAQAKMLRDLHGWEIGTHSMTEASHKSVTTLTAGQIEAEMIQLRAWQESEGIQSDSYAYPVGNYTPEAISIIQRYFGSARSNYMQLTAVDTNQPYRLPGMVLGHTSNTLARVKARLDVIASSGAWQPIVLHDIVTPVVTPNDWTIDNFNQVVDYVASKGIAVATVGEVLSS